MNDKEKKEIRLFNAAELNKQTGHSIGDFRHCKTDKPEVRRYLHMMQQQIIFGLKQLWK